MEVHTLEIDSSERDYATYPDPSDYVIDLKNRIYDIRKITLVSARIPNSQTLIHARNNTFSINTFDGISTSIELSGTFTNIETLRQSLNTQFTGTDIDVTSISNTLVLTNTHNSLTKYIDFTGSSIGIPSQPIEIIPGGAYQGKTITFTSDLLNLNFTVENISTLEVNLDNRSFNNGGDLVSYITEHISAIVATYDSNTHSMTWLNDSVYDKIIKLGNGTNARYLPNAHQDSLSNFNNSQYTTPHQIFGFPPTNILIKPSENYTGGSINLQGPNSLVLRLSSGSDNFNKDIYIREPFYTSHILLNGPFLNFSAADDPVKHDFFSGPQKFIESLRIQFFYMSNGRLIPYDFRNQDHVLKFEIQCNTGKFKSIAADTASDVGVLPPPISIPELEDPYRWKQYVLISIIVFFGLFVLTVTRKRT